MTKKVTKKKGALGSKKQLSLQETISNFIRIAEDDLETVRGSGIGIIMMG